MNMTYMTRQTRRNDEIEMTNLVQGVDNLMTKTSLRRV